MTRTTAQYLACITALALVLFSNSCAAAPYELTVYGDDMPEIGEGELETILSVARPRPDDDVHAAHVTQLMTELGYGLGKDWAVGLEIPTFLAGHSHKMAGAAIELQYVAPHDAEQGGYIGFRADVGRETSVYDSEAETAAELNPIFGYRWGHLHLTANPTLEIPLRGEDARAQFKPSARATWVLLPRNSVGVEYYGDWGALSSMRSGARRNETVYAVWERQFTHCRLNAGVGKGLHPSTGSDDRWVAKLALEIELD